MSSRFGRRAYLQVEALESRLAPATLISPTQLTYVDTDGEAVRVTFSKPILTSLAVANDIFKFNNGDVNNSNVAQQQLWEIDLTAAAGAKKTDITVELDFGTLGDLGGLGGGDFRANVGFINAEGIDLGKVSVQGDLGRIVAGDGLPTTALEKLRVTSIGVEGLTSQAPGGSLESYVYGPAGKIVVKETLQHAQLVVRNLGLLRIDGSLIGGSQSSRGNIYALGSIGEVRVGGNIQGDSGVESGSIYASGPIGDITIGGSVAGGSGAGSGRIVSNGAMGTVHIGGSLIGGTGRDSGVINANNGKLAGITVVSDVLGGAGERTGTIKASKDIGSVLIGGSLSGSAGSSSGVIATNGKIGPVSISGNLLGGSGTSSGQIHALGRIGDLTIGGDLDGNAAVGNESAVIYGKKIGNLVIGGNLRGGAGPRCGYIYTGLLLESLTIHGSLLGGAGGESGWVQGELDIGDVTIDGLIFGGSLVAQGSLGNISVGGSIVGFPGARVIIAAGGDGQPAARIASLTVGGSVEHTDILAGYDATLFGMLRRTNGDAVIGPVQVGIHWIASSLVAGVDRGSDGLVGTLDDGASVIGASTFISKIGPMTIGGIADGTASAGDSFGIVAELVKALSINGVPQTLTPGPFNDVDGITTNSMTGDFVLIERLA